MRYFPVFMDLRGQDVLVVGAGLVAERKIRLLIRAGARVHLAARSLSENVGNWQSNGTICSVEDDYSRQLLDGKRMVFAATNDTDLNRTVFQDAESRGILVNVVDNRECCRFISPAIVDRAPVQIAISSGGASPVLARRIRGWIELMLPPGLGNVARAAERLRAEVQRLFPFQSRRRFWESQLTDTNLLRWATDSEKQIAGELRQSLKRSDRISSQGRVYLVGSGPGRADLLTIRALKVLGQADVILHDRLVSEEILDLARRDADRIYVGKKAGDHHRTQREIHNIMLRAASEGKTVVRLKGGDAFIFGRGGEELEALRAAGVAYEVVPGITAATGCAAFAGIPLTHRDHAQVLSFVTGHFSAQNLPPPGKVDWARIAGPGKTVAVYMGIRQAGTIRQQLLDAGVSRHLPVALISDGTRDSQQILHGSVAELTRLAVQANDGSPGLLIIGQVAALGSNLRWFGEYSAVRTAA